MVSAQQEFNHHVKALEHQIELRDQARVALKMQIQDKDREKGKLEQQLCWKEEQIEAKEREKVELEQQLCQKEEQIQTKDREKVELEQQLHLREEHGPPDVTQVAEMQQEESFHVTAQGEILYIYIMQYIAEYSPMMFICF